MPNVTKPISPKFSTAARAAKYHAPELFTKNVYVPPIPSDPFDECVYNLIPIQITPPAQPPKYVSKYHDLVKKEYHLGTQKMASMGPLKIDGLDPKGFLKKGQKEKIKSQVHPTPNHHEKLKLKDPLPKALGILPKPQVPDFVKLNRKEIAHSHPPPPPSAPRVYSNKKNYGRPPQYPPTPNVATTKKQALRSTHEPMNESSSLGELELPETERLKILDGLKANWEKLNSEYQKLSLTVDTLPKITRKLNIEAQLKQLEEDIERFSHERIKIKL